MSCMLAAALCLSLLPTCVFTQVALAAGSAGANVTVTAQTTGDESGTVNLRCDGASGTTLQTHANSLVSIDVANTNDAYIAQVRYSVDGGTTFTALSSSAGYSLVVPEDTQEVQIYADYISKVWDGTVDVTWFDASTYAPAEGSGIEEQTDYYLTYPAQVAGLAALVNGIFNDYPITPVLDSEGNTQTYKGKGGAAAYLNKKTIVHPDVNRTEAKTDGDTGSGASAGSANADASEAEGSGEGQTEGINGAHLDGSKLYNTYTTEGASTGRITDSQNNYALCDARDTSTTVVGDASIIGARLESGNDDGGPNGNNQTTTSDYYYGIYSFKGKTVHLVADMDFGGKLKSDGTYSTESPNYMPIGGQYCMLPDNGYSKLSASFNGVLDGGGHTITNLYCERYANTEYGDSQSVGIVGRLGVHDNDAASLRPTNPAVRNIVLESGLISARRSIGGMVGKTGKTSFNNRDGSLGSIIENCINKATINGTDKKGTAGIVGASYNGGVVRNCANFGAVSNRMSTPTGGIVGYNENSIINCYNVGTIKAQTAYGVENSTYAEGIGTRNGDFNHYVSNCWWLTGSATGGYFGTKEGTGTDGNGGTGEGSCTEFGAGTDHARLTAADLNTKTSNVWRYVNGINTYKGVTYPSLWFQSEKTSKCTVTLEQPEHGSIGASVAYGNQVAVNSGAKVDAGTLLEVRYEAEPGYVCRGWLVNGENLSESSYDVELITDMSDITLTVTTDVTITANVEKSASTTVSLLEADGCTYAVTKSGSVYNKETGAFSKVENYPVSDGDTVYEGDKLYCTATPTQGAEPKEEGMEYLNTFTYLLSGYTMRSSDGGGTGAATVSQDLCEVDSEGKAKPLTIKVIRDTTERTWNNFVTSSKDAQYANWYNSSTSDKTEYTLDKPSDLAWLSQLVNTGTSFEGITIKLGADIDMGQMPEGTSKLFWKPIGDDSGSSSGSDRHVFQGIFDGCGYSITFENVVNTTYAGLFGHLGPRATVRNVTVKGTVATTQSYLGAIAGSITTGCVIENCVNEAAIENKGESYGTVEHTGGIVGLSEGGTVVGCANLGSVSGEKKVGGIVGSTATAQTASGQTTISSCYSAGTVVGKTRVGGVVGYMTGMGEKKPAKISSCYAAGTVSATGVTENNKTEAYAGSLVGYVQKCCSLVNVLCLEETAEQAIGFQMSMYAKTCTLSYKQVTSEELAAAAAELGSAFIDNQTAHNNGWPLLEATASETCDAAEEAQPHVLTSFLNADGSLQQKVMSESGATVQYHGKTPSKAYSASKHYTFAGWDASLDNLTQSSEVHPLFTEAAHAYTTKVTRKATYAKTGVRTYTCTVCGHSYTKTITKLKVTAKVKLVKGKTKSIKKKTLKVAWKKASGVSGYQVYCKIKGKGAKYVRISGAKKTSAQLKKLVSKKKATVKVRAYVKSKGKYYYGPWSASKKVKIK